MVLLQKSPDFFVWASIIYDGFGVNRYIVPFKNRRPNVSCPENSDERIKVLNKRVICYLFRTVRIYTIFFKESFNITSILKNSMITRMCGKVTYF